MNDTTDIPDDRIRFETLGLNAVRAIDKKTGVSVYCSQTTSATANRVLAAIRLRSKIREKKDKPPLG